MGQTLTVALIAAIGGTICLGFIIATVWISCYRKLRRHDVENMITLEPIRATAINTNTNFTTTAAAAIPPPPSTQQQPKWQQKQPSQAMVSHPQERAPSNQSLLNLMAPSQPKQAPKPSLQHAWAEPDPVTSAPSVKKTSSYTESDIDAATTRVLTPPSATIPMNAIDDSSHVLQIMALDTPAITVSPEAQPYENVVIMRPHKREPPPVIEPEPVPATTTTSIATIEVMNPLDDPLCTDVDTLMEADPTPWWCFERMSRFAAEQYLLADGAPDGLFLLRSQASLGTPLPTLLVEPPSFKLDICHHGEIMHYQVDMRNCNLFEDGIPVANPLSVADVTSELSRRLSGHLPCAPRVACRRSLMFRALVRARQSLPTMIPRLCRNDVLDALLQACPSPRAGQYVVWEDREWVGWFGLSVWNPVTSSLQHYPIEAAHTGVLVFYDPADASSHRVFASIADVIDFHSWNPEGLLLTLTDAVAVAAVAPYRAQAYENWAIGGLDVVAKPLSRQAALELLGEHQWLSGCYVLRPAPNRANSYILTVADELRQTAVHHRIDKSREGMHVIITNAGKASFRSIQDLLDYYNGSDELGALLTIRLW